MLKRDGITMQDIIDATRHRRGALRHDVSCHTAVGSMQPHHWNHDHPDILLHCNRHFRLTGVPDTATHFVGLGQIKHDD